MQTMRLFFSTLLSYLGCIPSMSVQMCFQVITECERLLLSMRADMHCLGHIMWKPYSTFLTFEWSLPNMSVHMTSVWLFFSMCAYMVFQFTNLWKSCSTLVRRVRLIYICFAYMVFQLPALWKSCFTLGTSIYLFNTMLANVVLEVTALSQSCFALVAFEWLLPSMSAQITSLWQSCSTIHTFVHCSVKIVRHTFGQCMASL